METGETIQSMDTMDKHAQDISMTHHATIKASRCLVIALQGLQFCMKAFVVGTVLRVAAVP